MKRLFVLLAALVLALGIPGSALAAEEELPHTGRVLFVAGGDISVGADEQADAVIVINGDAYIAGTVNSLVVVDGTATASGATVEGIAIVNGTLELEPGTTVLGDIGQLNSDIVQAEGVEIGGSVNDLAGDVAGFGVFIGFAALAFWIGVGIATLIVGLLLAGLAARQTRTATSLIRREPGRTFLVGLLAVVVPPILAVLAMVTIVGIPAGLGLLIVVWPLVAFVGYVVAAIWLGEWLLGRRDGAVTSDRPYAAATRRVAGRVRDRPRSPRQRGPVDLRPGCRGARRVANVASHSDHSTAGRYGPAGTCMNPLDAARQRSGRIWPNPQGGTP